MDFEKSSIERLKRTLYSRNENIVPKEKRTPVRGQETDVPKDWGTPETFNISLEDMAKKNNSFFNKFLVASLIFFVLSLAIAAFIFFGGLNMISSNNLDIKIVAPSSVSSGEDLLVGLTIVNGNRTDLENVVLFVTYPLGAQEVGIENRTLSRERIELGTISKGGTKDYSVRTLLFGEKDSLKVFNFRIEYKVKGSNAVFSKEKTLDMIIGSSPLLLNVDYPKEVNSGQEVKLSIDITSNSSVVMKDSLIKVEYPYGFTYKSSNLRPLRGNSIWNIGDLKNGDQKNITITGVLVGQNMEDRSFRISAGTLDSGSTSDFDTVLSESSVTIGIRKSFFDLQLDSSGGSSIAVGLQTQINIKWQNTLPDKIINSHIEATFSGNALDKSQVSTSDNGFYRSVDNVVVWDKNTTPELSEMLPGDNGNVVMTIASLANLTQGKLVKNPHIDIHFVMTGDRSGTDVSSVSSTGDISIKIKSNVGITSKSYRVVGPFTNTGPIPPKAEKETTYTITWILTNTTNDLKETLVSATLPSWASWKGEVSPTSEKLSYNPDTRTVTWNIGNVSAGTGFVYSPKEASFKVGIIPSVSQISLPAELIGTTNVSATDTYTETQISATAPQTSTQYSDPGFKPGDSIVVK